MWGCFAVQRVVRQRRKDGHDDSDVVTVCSRRRFFEIDMIGILLLLKIREIQALYCVNSPPSAVIACGSSSLAAGSVVVLVLKPLLLVSLAMKSELVIGTRNRMHRTYVDAAEAYRRVA